MSAPAAIGVNIMRARILCFLGTAPVLGAAGAIITLQKLRIAPQASFSISDWTVFVIFNVVIGGIGTVEGPIVGTVTFFLLREYFSDLGTWRLIILGTLSIVIIMVDRRGLWGLIRRFLLPDDLFPTGHRMDKILLRRTEVDAEKGLMSSRSIAWPITDKL
jgi:branched-chain amino acid transport system permease protein